MITFLYRSSYCGFSGVVVVAGGEVVEGVTGTSVGPTRGAGSAALTAAESAPMATKMMAVAATTAHVPDGR